MLTASPLHSHGDAMEIAVEAGRIVGVRGRPGSRVNRGRLGPKDMYGWQANHAPDRLTRPLVLAVIGRAGLRTNHIDGSTRLCTATAAEALKQTFACDGQPGTLADVDHCDVLFLVGHNVAPPR